MAIRFIHTADVHLDSPLVGLSAYEDAPAERLRGATRQAFEELVDRAIEEQVHFMVIAGDLYDGDWRDYNTGLFFSRQMGRLDRAGIPVFVLFGNHDAESEMTKRLRLPQNVKTFAANKPQTHLLEQYKVALHGQSFKEKETLDNLAFTYAPAVPNYTNIGVLHTALQGGFSNHKTYAPCTVDELHGKGYQYWALGHVHQYQQWDAQSTIVFPGNLQGRHARETGQKGAVLVTAHDNGHIEVERLPIDILRWESLSVDVSACRDTDDVAARVGKALESMLGSDGHVPRAVRVALTGRTPAHGVLTSRPGEVRAQVLAQIAAIDNDRLWLEKVVPQTQGPESAHTAGERREALADLAQIFKEAQQDSEFLQKLEDELRTFVTRTAEVRTADIDFMELARSGDFASLVERVAPDVLAQLGAEES